MQELLHIVNRYPTLAGKWLLHKHKIHRAMKFPLAVMQVPWKLAASMPCIIASLAAKVLIHVY
jgi:hypothetical protein